MAVNIVYKSVREREGVQKGEIRKRDNNGGLRSISSTTRWQKGISSLCFCFFQMKPFHLLSRTLYIPRSSSRGRGGRRKPLPLCRRPRSIGWTGSHRKCSECRAEKHQSGYPSVRIAVLAWRPLPPPPGLCSSSWPWTRWTWTHGVAPRCPPVNREKAQGIFSPKFP